MKQKKLLAISVIHAIVILTIFVATSFNSSLSADDKGGNPTPTPTPTPVPTRTPCPPPTPDPQSDPCGALRCAGVPNNVLGTVVCCDGDMSPCYLGNDVPPGNDLPGDEGDHPALPGLYDCIIAHEDSHIDSEEYECPPTGCPVIAEQLPELTEEDHFENECAAYLAEMACIVDSALDDCDGLSGQDKCDCLVGLNGRLSDIWNIMNSKYNCSPMPTYTPVPECSPSPTPSPTPCTDKDGNPC